MSQTANARDIHGGRSEKVRESPSSRNQPRQDKSGIRLESSCRVTLQVRTSWQRNSPKTIDLNHNPTRQRGIGVAKKDPSLTFRVVISGLSQNRRYFGTVPKCGCSSHFVTDIESPECRLSLCERRVSFAERKATMTQNGPFTPFHCLPNL